MTVWHRQDKAAPPCSVVERSRGMILVRWRRFLVAGCYSSPSDSSAEFGQFLDRLGAMVAPYLADPLLNLGDFNAKSTVRGNPRTNPRDGALVEWAEGMGLRSLNQGGR